MAGRDYLPGREAEFDLWVANYRAQIVTLGPGVGLMAADVGMFNDAADVWDTEYLAFQTARETARAAAERKDDARVALKALVRKQVRRAQASPAIDDATRAMLRITVPPAGRSLVAAPSDTPDVRLYFGDRGRIRVHFGPNPANENANGLPRGVYGVVIEYAENGPPATVDGWEHLTNRSASPYTHIVTTAAAKTFAYRCRYVNRKGEAGPWSAAVVGTVTP